MNKIQTTPETLLSDLRDFYKVQEWHFITVNCVDMLDGFEIQYFFAKYGERKENVCYFLHVAYEEEIPSVIGIFPSAYLGEGEVVDMFGAKIKGVSRGTFLDKDSIQTPLRIQQ